MKHRSQLHVRRLPGEPLELDGCRSGEFAKFDTLEQAQQAAVRWTELYQDCEWVVGEIGSATEA
jgi:hypothetical protein